MTIFTKKIEGLQLSHLYILLVGMLILTTSTLAQDTKETKVQAPAPLSVETLDIVSDDIPLARHNIEDVAKLGAWLDGVVSSYSKKDELAGVTISIVKNASTLTQRGYGIRTVETHLPVNPHETLFRIGSISKTFIWISLMQLQEQGKLSLEDPVDTYLPAGLKTNESGYSPILIKHLMSHSPGFEDRALGHLFSTDIDKVTSLKKYLETYKPARVREPGKNVSYSNYGAGLAAIIVENVSGKPFYTYVRDHITAPLGMFDTTYREPAPKERADLPLPITAFLEGRRSVAMERQLDQWKKGTYFYITQVGPVGSMVTTAPDMSNYMKMLLASGTLNNAAIITNNSNTLLQKTLLSMHKDVPGIAHGFMLYTLPEGITGYGHGGNTIYFHANMVIIPELNIGVFISTNGPNGHRLATDLPKLLVKRFYGNETAPLSPVGDFVVRGKKFSGEYMNNRRSYTGFDKLLALTGVTTVSVTQDGYLLTTTGDETRRWVEKSPMVFQDHDGDDLLTFSQGENGIITGMSHPRGVFEFEKIGFFEGPSWFFIITGLGLSLSLFTVVSSWSRRRNIVYMSLNEIFTLGALPIAAVTWLAFTVLMIFAMIEVQSLGPVIISNFPTNLLVSSLNVAIIGVVFTALSLITLPKVWTQTDWTRSRKIRHILMVIILLVMVATMNDWNLIGHKYY